MKEEILQMLKTRPDFISGQELCEHFNVSRTAVWKVIKQLKNEGYEIESVNRKGYHLVSSPDILSSEEILSGMKTEKLGRKVYYYDMIDTTNNQARKLAEMDAPDGTLVVAGIQEAGKGRRGRKFISPNTGAWFTLILKPEILPVKASMITLIAAMAVRDMLRSYGFEAGIKWPNDLVVDQHKITGILTEMSAEPDMINYIVVGIGVNVNTTEFPEELKEIATSMTLTKGETYRRAEVICRVIEAFEKYYKTFLEIQDLSFLTASYNESLVHMNKKISVHEIGRTWQGISRGINSEGTLLVETEDGITEVSSGEVSIRGLFGYVE